MKLDPTLTALIFTALGFIIKTGFSKIRAMYKPEAVVKPALNALNSKLFKNSAYAVKVENNIAVMGFETLYHAYTPSFRTKEEMEALQKIKEGTETLKKLEEGA